MDRIILILLAFFIGICLYYLVNDRCRCVNEVTGVNGVTGYNEVKGVNKVTGYKEGFSVGIARSKSEEDLDICDNDGNEHIELKNNRGELIHCGRHGELSKIIDDIYYIKVLCDGSFKGCARVHGDIRSLKVLPNLQIIKLSNTKVSGDIRSLSELPNLQQISLTGTKVSGDISSLSKLENLEYIYLADTKVSGDIKSLKHLSNLKELHLSGNPEITGDINDFLTSSNIKQIKIDDTKIRGDITDLAKIVHDKKHDFAESGFFGNNGIQNTNIYGDISKMAEMLITKGIKSIKIVGLDKTCVFYTRADDCTSPNNTAFCSLRGSSFIYIRNDSDHYNVHQFPTERGGDIEKGYPSQNKDCWSCSMTQSVIEDKYNDLNTLKKFYSTQHIKKPNGKSSNKKCPSLVYPMCNPKMDQLCPGNIICPDCGESSCNCPPSSYK